MITSPTRELVNFLTDQMMTIYVKECELGKSLRTMDDNQLTEVAYLIEDMINSHPDKPTTKRVQLSRIERYIAHHIQRANWQVAYDNLLDELDDLSEYDHDLFGDLDEELLKDLEDGD